MKFKPIAGVVVAASIALVAAGCSSSASPAEEDPAPGAEAAAGCEVDAAAEHVSEDAAKHITELCQAAKDNGEDELNLISGLPADIKPVLDLFTERFGIKINITDEIDPQLTTDLQSQIQSGNYVSDVLHNPNGQHYVEYAEPYHVEALTVPDDLQSSAAQIQDPDDLFTSPFLGFFGLGVFKPRAGDLHPELWSDLADPKYAGLIGMGDPTVPGPNQDTPIYLTQNGALTEDDVAAIFANAEGNIKGTYGDAVAGLMQGQFAFFFGAPSSAVYNAGRSGAPVEFRLMKEDNYVVTHKQLLIKNAPHPNAAKLYLEFLNLFSAQQAIATGGLTPLNAEAAADTVDEQPWTDWQAANLTEIIPADDIDAARAESVAWYKELLGK